MEVSASQYSKVSLLILVMLSGITMDLREELWKAEYPMLVTLFGIVMDLSALHP
jgi:hypothetical protein